MIIEAVVVNLSVVPTLWLWYWHQLLTPKYRSRWVVALQFLILVSYMLFILPLRNNWPQQTAWLRFLAGAFLNCFLIFFFYTDSLGRKIFTEITCEAVTMAGELVIIALAALISRSHALDALRSPRYSFLLYLMHSCILTIFYLLLATLVNRSAYGLDGGGFLRYGVFPLTHLVMMLLLSYQSISSSVSTASSVALMMFAACVSILSNIFLLRSMKDLSEKVRLESENEYLQQLQATQLKHYRALEQQHQLVREIRHDIQNHLLTVDMLLQQGKQDVARLQNDLFRKQVEAVGPLQYCENQIVNAIIYSKVQYACTLGIETTINVNISEGTGVSPVDLMRLFSNLMDNAIEGCQGLADDAPKWIKVQAAGHAGMLVIQITNTKGPIRGRAPLKPANEDRGNGLKIMTQIAQRYGGTLHYEDNEDTFLVALSLRMATADEPAVSV